KHRKPIGTMRLARPAPSGGGRDCYFHHLGISIVTDSAQSSAVLTQMADCQLTCRRPRQFRLANALVLANAAGVWSPAAGRWCADSQAGLAELKQAYDRARPGVGRFGEAARMESDDNDRQTRNR